MTTSIARRVVRPPAAAGHFYPADPVELRELVDTLIAEQSSGAAGDRIAGPAILISPHAGYVYSGPVAAAGYARLAGLSFTTIIIVSPSHREFFDGISIYDGEAYETPLGRIAVDGTLSGRLARSGAPFILSDNGHGREHGVEVQLPFIQLLWPGARIVPIVMGDQNPEYCRLLGTWLGGLPPDNGRLIVASTDLSHYHPYDEANRIDARFIGLVNARDPEALIDALGSGAVEACGGGPAAAALIAAAESRADATVIAGHCNSGDVTGDRSSVVGYLSALAFRNR